MESKYLAILLLRAILVSKVAWELYLSPVARQHIPGPRRAAISDLWQYWLQFRRRRTLTFHRLFEVRMGCEYRFMGRCLTCLSITAQSLGLDRIACSSATSKLFKLSTVHTTSVRAAGIAP